MLLEYMRSVRELERMVDPDAVSHYIHGIQSTVAALAQMACVMAKEKPEAFQRFATIVQYNGAVWWEWYLRRGNADELMGMMDKLGRASAGISHSLYPLDDKTHPVNRENPAQCLSPDAQDAECERRGHFVDRMVQVHGAAFGERVRQSIDAIPLATRAPLDGIERAIFQEVFGAQIEAAERMCHTPFHSDGDLAEERVQREG